MFCIFYSYTCFFITYLLNFTVCPFSGRFMCPNSCGRSYKERHNLIRHLRKECGVAPQHECHQCSKAFKHKAHLTRHLLSCSNIPPSFKCNFCERMFRCRDTLKKHTLLVHKTLERYTE